jgi:hypothetical protein
MPLHDRIAALADPAHVEGRIGAKVQSRSRDKRRGLLVAFIDARTVAAALDSVLGAAGWETMVPELPQAVMLADADGVPRLAGYAVRVGLRLRVGDEAAERWDVGWNAHSPRSDIGTAAKGCVSDGLKRAAAQFGLGRPLYDLPQEWIRLNDAGYPADASEVNAVIERWNAILRGEAAPPRVQSDAVDGADDGDGGGDGMVSGTRSGGGTAKASAKQLALIRRLVRERETAQPILDAALAAASVATAEELTVPQASAVIDRLLKASDGGSGAYGDDPGREDEASW